jgi:D-cysteine desulfhydrase
LERALFTTFPELEGRLALAPLGDFPTPVDDLAEVMRAAGAPGFPAWVKRDDVSSPVYGGNKVRTLEVLFGAAKAAGKTRIYATGAFGSNHAAATVLHAPRAGLEPGLVLFPQPFSEAALENLRVVLSRRPPTVALAHWSTLPFGMSIARRRAAREGVRAEVMVPGGATPEGGLGYVSAALELAHQIEAGAMPRPDTVVVGVGSTCTSAGLLVGFHHAARLGIGFVGSRGEPAPPKLVSVRVTPWPVTAPWRIARLAVRISRELARLADDPSLEVSYGALRSHLEVDGRYLGKGYGYPTETGREAIELFSALRGLALDTTYSGKSAASVIARARRGEGGPILFWSTKSTVPLPEVTPDMLEWAPPVMRRWMERGAP